MKIKINFYSKSYNSSAVEKWEIEKSMFTAQK